MFNDDNCTHPMGHNYTKNLYVTSKLPAGYRYEECKHCGDDRTVHSG